ncbi:hypothetical protein L1887_24342 [Cichorium endivia]|nr:hypothetical protein L1887_24342 [Cichorium endivia]
MPFAESSIYSHLPPTSVIHISLVFHVMHQSTIHSRNSFDFLCFEPLKDLIVYAANLGGGVWRLRDRRGRRRGRRLGATYRYLNLKRTSSSDEEWSRYLCTRSFIPQ